MEIDPGQRGFQPDLASLQRDIGLCNADIGASSRSASAALRRIDELLAHTNGRHRELVAVEVPCVGPRCREVPNTKIERRVRQAIGGNRCRLCRLDAGRARHHTRRFALRAFECRVECQRLGGKLHRQNEQSQKGS